MPKLNFDKAYFEDAKEKVDKYVEISDEIVDCISTTKSSLPCDYVSSSSVDSLCNNINTLCSKSRDIKSAFSELENILLEIYSEEYLNSSEYAGSYYLQFGIELDLDNLNPGFNYFEGIHDKDAVKGQYIVYIPENYDGSSVGLSLIFHDSAISAFGSVTNEYVSQMLASGEYDSNSIIVIPKANSGQAISTSSGDTFYCEEMQNWIMELVTGLESKYNVDQNNVSLTSSSAGQPGAVSTVLNNLDYFSELNLAATFGSKSATNYDYTRAETSAKFKMVDSLKEISEAGVTVNLYTAYSTSNIYDDYPNVNVYRIPACENNHGAQIEYVYKNEDYLASIGISKKSE